MRKFLCIAVLVLVVLPACGPGEVEPPPPPPAPPPEPPSADQLYSDTMKIIEPLLVPGAVERRTEIQTALRTEQGKLKAQENGYPAELRIQNELSKRFKDQYDKEDWPMVLVLGHAVSFFEPDSSRVQTYMGRAQDEINRPKITLKSFAEVDTQAPVVMMDVYLPVEKKTVSVTARVGDEFHNMRLDRIIGRNSGIAVTYIKTGRQYEEKVRP